MAVPGGQSREHRGLLQRGGHRTAFWKAQAERICEEKGPSARQEGARQTKKSIWHFIRVGADDQVAMCRVSFMESDKKHMSFYKLNNPLGWLTCESCPVGIESLCWRVWALTSWPQKSTSVKFGHLYSGVYPNHFNGNTTKPSLILH